MEERRRGRFENRNLGRDEPEQRERLGAGGVLSPAEKVLSSKATAARDRRVSRETGRLKQSVVWW